jgi:hypothetical protein
LLAISHLCDISRAPVIRSYNIARLKVSLL